MPLSLVLSFVTPYKYAIEPRNQAIGVNCASPSPSLYPLAFRSFGLLISARASS